MLGGPLLVRGLHAALFAGLLSTSPAVAAQPIGPQQAIPQRTTVNFRLDVAPDQVAELQTAIANIPNARVAEPADYTLTTKKDFPQTLLAVDARHPKENVEYNDDGDVLELRTRTVEVGNLLDPDYRRKLNAIVAHASLGKSILNLPETTGPVRTCIKAGSFDPEPAAFDACRSGPMQFPETDPNEFSVPERSDKHLIRDYPK